MGTHEKLTGRFVVALPADEAFVLFTPEGEREWVSGWDPVFPAAPDDDTVFQTGHGTTWVVVGRSPGRSVRYARINPTLDAGTVTVTLHPVGAESTEVEVTYELTALTGPGRAHLRSFAADYPAYLAGWRTAIEAALVARCAQAQG